jgi:pimeloyl-ACP methyl ester carboxylesterase
MEGTGLAHDDAGTGPALVFLHGITCDRSNWAPVVELLADDFRCVNADLPGHGDSPRTGAYDVFSQAVAVGAFIADKGLEQPVVVGHSYGAFIATLMGATAPVRGVVNVDQELDAAAFARRIAPLEGRLRGDDFDAAFREFVATLRLDLVPEERRAAVVMRPDREVVHGVWGTVFDTPPDDLVAMVEPTLAAYPVPYLAIYGAPVSAEERRLLDLIPEVDVEEWDGLGHFVQLADPVRTAARIRRFAGAR